MWAALQLRGSAGWLAAAAAGSSSAAEALGSHIMVVS